MGRSGRQARLLQDLEPVQPLKLVPLHVGMTVLMVTLQWSLRLNLTLVSKFQSQTMVRNVILATTVVGLTQQQLQKVLSLTFIKTKKNKNLGLA